MSDEQKMPPVSVVDLDEHKKQVRDGRFFEIRSPQYPDCNHMWRGVTLDSGTRRVFCKCGAQIDPFDALLIYARAETRLVSTREQIAEHERKEAEKKARRPFFRRHTGYAARQDRSGYDMTLECGHQVFWDTSGRRRKGAPRGVTCHVCIREAKLKEHGVAVVGK